MGTVFRCAFTTALGPAGFSLKSKKGYIGKRVVENFIGPDMA